MESVVYDIANPFVIIPALATVVALALLLFSPRSQWLMASYLIIASFILAFVAPYVVNRGSAAPGYRSACENFSLSGTEEWKIYKEITEREFPLTLPLPYSGSGARPDALYVPPSFFRASPAKCLVMIPSGRVYDFSFVMNTIAGILESKGNDEKESDRLRSEFKAAKESE